MITLSCPSCQTRLQVQDNLAGKKVRCPKCKQTTDLPSVTLALEPAKPSLSQGPIVPSVIAPASFDEDATVSRSLPAPADTVPSPRSERNGALDDHESRQSLKAEANYEVEGEIARGGMGAIMLAVDQEIRREVAVKFLLNHADDQLKARFVEEAQITGQLEHPNIVPIYHLGAHPDGRAFFSMKIVKGQSLAEILKDEKSKHTLSRLVNVFVSICNGMAYAHSRDVIHRDLKPANVMVGDFGEVYVMDWGLAKVLDSASEKCMPPDSAPDAESGGPPLATFVASSVTTTRRTFGDLTQAGAIMGTPAYMPPEQAQGQNVDQRADIYSLGAILYEIMTLTPPVGRDADKFVILMRVVEGQIDPPQERAPERVKDGWVPPELSAIAMKALAANPADRYQTMEALRQDVELFLEGRSVSAKQDSFREIAWKLVKRNKGASVAAAIGTLLLLAVLAVSFFFINAARLRAQDERNNAQIERAKAEDERTNAQIERARAEDERNNAEIERGKAELAAKQALAAADAERKATLTAQKRLAQIEKANQILVSIFKDIDPRADEKGGPPLRVQLGSRLEKIADTLDLDLTDDPKTLASMQSFLGNTLISLGNTKKGIELLAKAHAALATSLGRDHPDALSTMTNLANAYQADGQLDKAFPLYEELLAKRMTRHGPDHPDTLNSLNNLAAAYQGAGQWAKALRLFEDTFAKVKVQLGPDHPATLTCMSNVAVAYLFSGQIAKALPLSEETLARRKAVLGPDHPDTLTSMNSLAGAYYANGQVAKALPLFEETLARRKAQVGLDHPDTLTSMNSLAAAYGSTGQLAKAIALFEETVAKKKVKLGPDHPSTLYTMNNLANTYHAAGQTLKALSLHEETLARRRAKLGPDHPDTLASLQNLATIYIRTKNPSKALPLFDEFVKMSRKQFPPADPRLANVLAPIGADLLKYGQHVAAESVLRECLEIQSKSQPNAWATFNMKSMLGASLLGQKKYAEAEPLLLQGYAGLKQREKTLPAQTRPRVTEALERLVLLYAALGKADEAERWRKELARQRGPK